MLLARLITAIPIAALLVGIYVGNGIVILIVSLYYLLFGFALSRLIYASFANGVFDKYLNPNIEAHRSARACVRAARMTICRKTMRMTTARTSEFT